MDTHLKPQSETSDNKNDSRNHTVPNIPEASHHTNVEKESESVHPPNHPFLKQVYTFEKNYAAGTGASFAASIGDTGLPKLEELGDKVEEMESFIEKALEFYQSKNFDIIFQHEYPSSVKYRFLTEELPLRTNHFGERPEMKVGISFEEYHPNHSASLEEGVMSFMQAMESLEADDLKNCLSPVQFLPEGPYAAQTLIDALQNRFEQVQKLEGFEYAILETSYDLDYDDSGMVIDGNGYADGLVTYDVVNKSGERKHISGPFKFYFNYDMGVWAIIYLQFPGLKYPQNPKTTVVAEMAS